ncbi:Sialin [Lamellibrachia satsuma]|nr:Sialin [Lamellibrachia satsuma]
MGKTEHAAAEDSLAAENGNVKSFSMDEGKVPCWTSCRVALSVVLMLNMAMLYFLRVNLSVAIICMVKTPVGGEDNFSLARSNATALSGYKIDDEGVVTTLNQGEFEWSKVLQGNILSAFYFGYILTQIPGGWLATKFGGKHVMGTGLLIGVACSMVTPMAARTHPYLLIFVRIVMGIGMGVFFPTTHNFWGRWAPPMERSKLIVFSQSGIMVGTVAAMSLSGYLCHCPVDNGWPMIFYVYGVIAFFCWMLFMYVAYNTPEEHPRITAAEKRFITKSIGSGTYKKVEHTPWLQFLKSPALFAIIVAHTANNWGNYTLVSCIPMYIRDVFKTDVKKNGLLSALPFCTMFVMAIAASQLADFVRRKKIATTVLTRKIFQTIGFMIPAVMVVALGYMKSSQVTMAIVFLTIGVGFTGISRSGYAVNHVDIAPRYAGILMGISNTVATIPGVVSPTLAGALTTNGTQAEWQRVFFICAAVYVIGTVAFVFLARGEEQPWARDDTMTSTTSTVGASTTVDFTNKRGRYMEITQK